MGVVRVTSSYSKNHSTGAEGPRGDTYFSLPGSAQKCQFANERPGFGWAFSNPFGRGVGLGEDWVE